MNAINKLTLAAVVSIFTLFSGLSVAIADTPDISGSYTCKGPNFTETLIFKKNGDVYNAKLIHEGDSLPYDYGTALFNPALKNAFSMVYFSVKGDSTEGGNEIFVIKSDGSIEGLYQEPGETVKTNNEVCIKS